MLLSATTGLEIRVSRNHDAMSTQAAQIIIGDIKKKPDLLLCASAGATPRRTYNYLAAEHRHRPKLFGKLRIIQIDEWGGLPRRSPASCEVDLRSNLIDPLSLGPDRFVGFRSDARQPKGECRRISKWL